jgi:hypothetical protein
MTKTTDNPDNHAVDDVDDDNDDNDDNVRFCSGGQRILCPLLCTCPGQAGPQECVVHSGRQWFHGWHRNTGQNA